MPLIRRDTNELDAQRADPAQLLIALTQGSTDERWAAARSLGATTEQIEALGDALGREADAHVRNAIFTGLARIASPASVAAILPYLRSDDSNLRTGALDALGAMSQVVRPQLGELLTDREPDVRLLACEIVRKLPSDEATSLLIALLDREAEANVCASAVDVLAESGGPQALPALARCAERFANEPFLVFSVKVAAERIRAAGADPRDGVDKGG